MRFVKSRYFWPLVLLWWGLLSPLGAGAGVMEPIKIGGTLGLSGQYAIMARDQHRAFQLWAAELNARGGLLGREVRLILLDDRSDPARARELYSDDPFARDAAAGIRKQAKWLRPALREVLIELDVPCLTGRFRVDSRGRQLRNFTLVTQWQQGRLEVVYPRELMTAEPLL